jgi:class 3 adenylate cyclase
MSASFLSKAHAVVRGFPRATIKWPRSLLACFTLLLFTAPSFALDHVSLQLKWKHQFQFAGYYAALAQGFYRDAGLDVEIREGGPDIDAAKVVSEGKADFGVCTSSVLINRARGHNLVVLGVVFQHSAAILLVPSRAGITTLSDLEGRRLMDAPDSDDLAAMLKSQGVDYAAMPRVKHNGDPQDLLSGKADAMVAYSTNEPFILALVAIGGLLWITLRGGRLTAALGALRLSAVMSAVFVCLSIPILIFILLYNYERTSADIVSTLRNSVAKANQASIESTNELLQPVAGALRMLAGMAAADLGFFRTAASAQLLYDALTSAEQIDAVYVSFEDGYHRVVTRIDDDRRRSDPEIPAAANWHSSYIDDFSAAKDRARHRTFSDTWPHVVGQYSVATSMDIRTLPGYAAAKASGGFAVTDPSINPDTGYPVIYVRYPIIRNGVFIGVASANITLVVLSRFLANHRASEHSTTLVADPSDGKIIATPDRNNGVRTVDGRLEVANLDNIANPNVREAYRQQVRTNQDQFLLRSPVNGEELSASFIRFPGSLGQRWEVVTLTPTDDFVGNLKTTNRQMAAVIMGLTAVEFVLIYFLCTRLARPIESVSQDLKSVEGLSFDSTPTRPSQIKEIAQLQSAAALLRNSLQSFSSFVPLDVVRELVRSGTPLTLGVKSRQLTVFFSDLENFSTHAEAMAPDELLGQMSVYFEQVSRAISEEHGTVDKFIGDGVMAFWSAPDAAYRSRVAGVRRRAAGRTADGSSQRGVESGGPPNHPHARRTAHRECPGGERRLVRTIELYGDGRRRQRCRSARRDEQRVRHHDLHQR